jgi:hypothetical protein
MVAPLMQPLASIGADEVTDHMTIRPSVVKPPKMVFLIMSNGYVLAVSSMRSTYLREWALTLSLLSEGALGNFRQILNREFPIDEMIEERLHEVRPAVLEIEIVGVLPDVTANEGCLSQRNRVDGVRGFYDRELSMIEDKPHPPAAELLRGRFAKLRTKLFVAAE